MAKKQKLLFKPTPISRLRHYKSPIKMVGDPPWRDWKTRCENVYQYEIERKNWAAAWSPVMWLKAWSDNEHLDFLIEEKWNIYEEAWEDNCHFDYAEAIRDNSAWDYHHETQLEPT